MKGLLCVATACLSLALASSWASGTLDSPPPDFPDPEDLATYPVKGTPQSIIRRLKRSGCGFESADMSNFGLASGAISRPAGGGFMVRHGSLSNGSRWLAMQPEDDPSAYYCALVINPNGNASSVSVINVRSENVPRAVDAVQSGKFFCKCRELAR